MVRLSANEFSKSFPRIFRISIENLTGLAIATYFSGWNYVNEYFAFFNVNRSSFAFNDYTIFLYSFFVIAKVPLIVAAGTLKSFLGLTFLIVTLTILATEFHKCPPALIALARRLLVVATGLAFVYLFSIEAGRIDAERVSQGQARQIDVTLAPSFFRAYEEQYGERRSAIWRKDLLQANQNDAFALIWRNTEETLLLQFDTTEGCNHGKPTVTFRVPNDHIVLLERTWEVTSCCQC